MNEAKKKGQNFKKKRENSIPTYQQNIFWFRFKHKFSRGVI